MGKQELDAPQDLSTLVPDGEYYVIYKSFDTGVVGGSKKYFVHFVITDGEHQGKPLTRFYNVPKGPRLARSHSLYRDYARLYGKRPPKRIRPDQFLAGRELKAHVVKVARIQSGGSWQETPADLQYSKIDELMEITMGDRTESRR